MQQWNPDQYAATGRFVSDLGAPLIDLLAPQPGERVLDLGCGDGALTQKLHEAGCVALGVDASPDMVEAARRLGLDAQVLDGHALPFENEFDAVFSNAALHWMLHPEAVIESVWRALKPGGRFVGELGGHGNIRTIVKAVEDALEQRGVAAKNPWFFPRPEQYRGLLEDQGFKVASLRLFERPTPLPSDISTWLETFAQPLISLLPTSEQHALVREVTQSLAPILCDEAGHWQADYVRLRFSASKPQ